MWAQWVQFSSISQVYFKLPWIFFFSPLHMLIWRYLRGLKNGGEKIEALNTRRRWSSEQESSRTKKLLIIAARNSLFGSIVYKNSYFNFFLLCRRRRACVAAIMKLETVSSSTSARESHFGILETRNVVSLPPPLPAIIWQSNWDSWRMLVRGETERGEPCSEY